MTFNLLYTYEAINNQQRKAESIFIQQLV